MTPLKAAFQRARAERNIELILPVLQAATLYVVVAQEPNSGPDSFFLTRSPTAERWCVTVAEAESALEKVQWPKRKISGSQLLKELPAELEIVVTYPDGGDYITREQLDWYRRAK